MINNHPAKTGQEIHAAFLEIAERRLANHAPVARALREGSPSTIAEIIALAYVQVELWEKGSLCSMDYISTWKELLQDPVKAAELLEERSSRANALRQNSPFVATVRKFLG